MDSTDSDTSGFNDDDADDFSKGDDESESVDIGCGAGFVCSPHSSVPEVTAVDTVDVSKYRPTQFC